MESRETKKDVRMKRTIHIIVALAFLFGLFNGCAIGPDYKRPKVKAPEQHRGLDKPSDNASLADLPWWDIFKDESLTTLVTEALKNNKDLLVAAARVEQMRALVGVAKSDFYPQINYQAQGVRGQNALQYGIMSNSQSNAFIGDLNLTWELDVWGKIRRSTESARAQLMSSEEFRRTVIMSLVANVAQAYFELRELDLELEIAKKMTQAFKDAYDLFDRRYQKGTASKLETTRAAASLAQAAATIPQTENLIFAKENQINLLLGRNPQPIPRGVILTAQWMPPSTPAGLPSTLLERRPDVRKAEEDLRAANAQIGVTKANFFPSIGLTGMFGGASADLQTFAMSWAAGGGFTGPAFQGGKVYYNYEAAKAQYEQSKQQYEQAVLTAFQDVSNALKNQEKLVGVSAELKKNVEFLRESVKLSTMRYVGGLASYYEVLEALQQLLPGENSFAEAQRDQLLAVIQLYKSLGGGWAVPKIEGQKEQGTGGVLSVPLPPSETDTGSKNPAKTDSTPLNK